MSQEYDNELRGVLFKNRDKDDDDEKAADYTGSCQVEGVEYFLDAWLRESKAGAKFLSLRLKAKKPRAAPAPAPAKAKAAAPPPAQPSFDDDEIPF